MADNRRLEQYLMEMSKREFSWPENNCMSFVVDYLDLEVVKPEWFKGHTSQLKAYKAYKAKGREIGYEHLADVFDDYLRPEMTLHPRDGFVVARQGSDLFGFSYGICYKGFNLFFTEDKGLCAFTPNPLDLYWSIK